MKDWYLNQLIASWEPDIPWQHERIKHPSDFYKYEKGNKKITDFLAGPPETDYSEGLYKTNYNRMNKGNVLDPK